jgi:anti-sigma B factor antagonist
MGEQENTGGGRFASRLFDLVCEPLPDGGVAVRLSGDLDLENAKAMESALVEAARSRIPRVVADLRGCQFVDSSGLRALIVANRNVRRASGGTVLELVIEADSQVARLLELTGMDETFTVRASD